jgi:hypothetical protein
MAYFPRRRQWLLAALLILFTLPAAAQIGASLSAAPAVVNLQGKAGQTTTQTLTVSNGTAMTMAFDMIAKDVAVRDGKRVFVNAGDLPGSIAATAVFSKRSVVVKAGEIGRVDVTVTIPPRPSGRAMVAFFQGTTKIPSGPVSATASLGILFVFTLSDNISIQARPLMIQPPTRSSNLTASQECINDGTEPVVAKGILAIVDRAGRVVGKSGIPDHRLLPGERMTMKTDYGGELTPGRYRALVTYDLGPKSLTSTAEFQVR